MAVYGTKGIIGLPVFKLLPPISVCIVLSIDLLFNYWRLLKFPIFLHNVSPRRQILQRATSLISLPIRPRNFQLASTVNYSLSVYHESLMWE